MRSLIALGGNQGAVENTFRLALNELDSLTEISVTRTSSLYRSVPVGQRAGGEFLNAAAELSVTCSPLALLDELQAIEIRHGRKRSERWGPRTLDLDLLFYGEEIVAHPRLIVPHPECWYRRFVLDPLAEIAGEMLHPVKRLTIQELQTRLLPRPLSVSVCGGLSDERQTLCQTLASQFADATVEAWSPSDPQLPVLLLWLGEAGVQPVPFADLPLVPRLDLTRYPESSVVAARNVLTAALGNPSEVVRRTPKG